MRKIIRFSILTLLVTFIALIGQAQTVTITLEDPLNALAKGEQLEVQQVQPDGSYTRITQLTENENGNWVGTFDSGSNSIDYIYAVVQRNGEVVREGWFNRRYDPLYSGTQIRDVLRFMGGETLIKPITLELSLDLEGLKLGGESLEEVGVMGSYGDLSWELPDGVTKLTQESNGIWKAIVKFPRGTLTDFPIKFVWQHQGVWYWEQLAGYVDHLLILDSNANRFHASFKYNPQNSRIEAQAGEGVQVSQYAEAASQFGGTRNYGYYYAMELVDRGDYTGAQTAYQNYRINYKETHNDDFHGYLTQVLSQNGQVEQALAVAEHEFENEPEPYRKAYYKYLKGRVLLNNKRPAESRKEMEEALSFAPEYDKETIRGYALLGIGRSYMEEEDTSLVNKAEAILEELATAAPSEQMRRLGLEQLARLGEKKNDHALLKKSMERMQETGTTEQRIQSRLRWIERRMQQHQLIDSTLSLDIQWLEWTLEEGEPRNKVTLLKADYFMHTGAEEEAIQLLIELEEKGKSEVQRQEARTRLENLDKNWEKRKKNNIEQGIRATSADSLEGGQL